MFVETGNLLRFDTKDGFCVRFRLASGQIPSGSIVCRYGRHSTSMAIWDTPTMFTIYVMIFNLGIS